MHCRQAPRHWFLGYALYREVICLFTSPCSLLTRKSSCTSQDAARHGSCSFEWAQLWHTTAKLSTSPATCRAACYLLHCMMANGLVLYQNIAEDVDSMVTATEISTPAILSDSSLSLMTHILHIRNMEVPGGSTVACHHIIRWISARWNPGKLPLEHLS
jgi:ataxia telangiectasia mutated family protein